MRRIEIGKHGKKSVYLDLGILLRTRLLIQANSGGGKSWILRRLAEQLFGKIPVVIIDPEGEFATLREKFGFVLVGKGGETPADTRSAQLVAHRLLELRASAVCDIYELKPQTRHAWVRLFLEAMVDAPKSLWRPTVVIVDEAHTLCPEKGQGESEAFGAMQDIVTRGRKRGFVPIFATQRLAKLSKNVSAEMLNRLVGQTFEDVDQERAADLLSIPRSEREEFFREMKVIEPGNFWALGRAIAKDRILVKVGPVMTTHPEPGKGGYSDVPPPTPAKIKALLPKLTDLPKEADQKARTEAEFRGEIRSLKAQLAAKQPLQKIQSSVQFKERIVEVPVFTKRQIRALERELSDLGKIHEGMILSAKAVEGAARALSGAITAAKTKGLPPKPITMPVRLAVQSLPPKVPLDRDGDVPQLIAGERRMLQVLAQFHPGSRTRSQLGVLAGYSPSGGTFGNYFGKLKRLNFLKEDGDSITITAEGLQVFGNAVPQGPQTPEDLLQMWRSKLLAGERKMLDVLVAAYPDPITRDDLGERTGYEYTGGTFGNYLGTLRRNKLAVIAGETVKASETLFEFQEA